MIALGKTPQNLKKVTLDQYMPSPPKPSHTHRTIFTPKLKSRQQQRSMMERSAPAGPLDSSPNPPRPLKDMRHFEKVELEDFLVEAIVGQNNFPEKSADIIRSLNGTWFKDTSHPEPVSSRFFSSLGFKHRKLAAQMGHRLSKTASLLDVESQFYTHYTPPNLFPSRRGSSPGKHQGSRKPSMPAPAPAKPELVANILRRVGGNSARRTFRTNSRSNSVQGFGVRAVGESEEVLHGLKMVLHRE